MNLENLKKTLLSLPLFLLVFPLSKADVGDCAIYFCEIKLKDQSVLKGYLQANAEAARSPKTDSILWFYLHSTVKLYENIYRIPSFKNGSTVLTLAAEEETLEILKEDISSVRTLNFHACEYIEGRGYSTKEFLIREYHPIIDELTKKEIALLHDKPLFIHGMPDWDIGSVVVYNYNTHLSEEEFVELAEKLNIRKHEEESWKEYHKCWMENYKRLKKAYREKDMIVLSFMSYT